MASLYCTYVSGNGRCCNSRTIVRDGQRIFCERHHSRVLDRNAAYKARADAYNADPALVAAKAAYTAAYTEARVAATTPDTWFDIPLEERTRIRLPNVGEDATKESVWRLCEQYGRTGPIAFTTKEGVRNASVSFYTHDEAAYALGCLDGAVWVERLLRLSQAPPPWVVDAMPAVAAAKRRMNEEMTAARERQQPGILAAEAAEEARERAEEEAEREEEARRDAMEAEAERYEWEMQEREMKYERQRAHIQRRAEEDYDDNYGEW
jgi:hypothetical protein